MLPKAKKTVFLIRHGQSVDNTLAVYQSRHSPLSFKGKEQANQIAYRISKLKFDSLISSPFTRASETANYIALKSGKKVIYSDLFSERILPSSLDGKSWEDDSANRIYKQWEQSLYKSGLRVEDGENYSDLIERADAALSFLLNRPEHLMVVVSHGHFIRLYELLYLEFF